MSAPSAQTMQELKAQMTLLEREVKILKGKLLNRNPKALEAAQREIQEQEKKLEKARTTLFSFISDLLEPKSLAELKTRQEVLTQAAIQYFKEIKMDPELWKEIES